MKTNVTLKLVTDLLGEARVVAAEEGRSISALLTDRLETIVRERKAFDKARRRALALLRKGLDLQWTPQSRDELHERPAVMIGPMLGPCHTAAPTIRRRLRWGDAGRRRARHSGLHGAGAGQGQVG